MSTTDRFLRLLLVVVIAVLLVPLLMMLFMMPTMGMWGMGQLWNMPIGTTGVPWMIALMWLFALAAILGLGYLLYTVFRTPQAAVDPALQELRNAYARGDLSDEEFEQRRDRLQREQ